MKVSQSMLFVGLGGTGLQIGEHLERGLREAMCGPDGRALLGDLPDLQPYELPGYLQFVYGDFAVDDLEGLKRRLTQGVGDDTVGRTSTFLRNLVPPMESSPQVTAMLRTGVPNLVKTWLPPEESEPQISPLINGAGQIPTVGRAAFFATLQQSGGLSPVVEPIKSALSSMGRAAGQLRAVSTNPPNACDVFVAFSVAGGTGCGVFYDFLHILGDVFRHELPNYTIRMYPLVVLPSAFDPTTKGGGRVGRLNAAPALFDLFRLVDQQNRGARDALSWSIDYPGQRSLSLAPATIQTAFLFSRPAALEREDLHRSIVSFVLSLVGSEPKQQERDPQQGPTASTSISFADWFINHQVDRTGPSPTGVGRRPVSSAIAGSLTVPENQIAELLTNHLLAQAIEELRLPAAGETNDGLRRDFINAAGLGPLLTRSPRGGPEDPDMSQKGADVIREQIGKRYSEMRKSLESLRKWLATDMIPSLLRFRYSSAVTAVAHDVDLFRIRRVAMGDPQLREEKDRDGFIGFLEKVGQPVGNPAKFSPESPATPQLKNPWLGLRKLRWSDPPAHRARELQDSWYRWRARSEWHAAWSGMRVTWTQTAQNMERQLAELLDVFLQFAYREPEQFASACQELYRPRTGVAYFLPDGGGDRNLLPFYQLLLRRLRKRLGLESEQYGEIVSRILAIDGGGWAGVWRAYENGSAADALRLVKERIKREIGSCLEAPWEHEEPLLPGLDHLLRAVSRGAGGDGSSELIRRFTTAINSLLPGGFEPEGEGPLRILVSYPAGDEDPQVEAFLSRELNLPREQGVEYEPSDTGTLVVNLSKTSMGVTEVAECRELIRLWALALEAPQQEDRLRWRQRLGYDFRWLLTTERDRVEILHRFLNVLWDGHVDVVLGTPDAPQEVVVRQPLAPGAIPIRLTMRSFGTASSWGDLINAYEAFSLTDDPSKREACRWMMNYLPVNLAEGKGHVKEPSPLYEAFVETAAEQVAVLDALKESLAAAPARSRADRLADFWRETYPLAVRNEFEHEGKYYKNHEEMQADYSLGRSWTTT